MDQVDQFGRSTTLVHYVFRVDPERIACMPNMTEFHATPYHTNYQRSNSTGAITCPACKTTEVFKLAKGRNG